MKIKMENNQQKIEKVNSSTQTKPNLAPKEFNIK